MKKQKTVLRIELKGNDELRFRDVKKGYDGLRDDEVVKACILSTFKKLKRK